MVGGRSRILLGGAEAAFWERSLGAGGGRPLLATRWCPARALASESQTLPASPEGRRMQKEALRTRRTFWVPTPWLIREPTPGAEGRGWPVPAQGSKERFLWKGTKPVLPGSAGKPGLGKLRLKESCAAACFYQ